MADLNRHIRNVTFTEESVTCTTISYDDDYEDWASGRLLQRRESRSFVSINGSVYEVMPNGVLRQCAGHLFGGTGGTLAFDPDKLTLIDFCKKELFGRSYKRILKNEGAPESAP